MTFLTTYLYRVMTANCKHTLNVRKGSLHLVGLTSRSWECLEREYRFPDPEEVSFYFLIHNPPSPYTQSQPLASWTHHRKHFSRPHCKRSNAFNLQHNSIRNALNHTHYLLC